MSKRHYVALVAALTLCFVALMLFFASESRDIKAETVRPHDRYDIRIILKARANPPDFWRIVEQGVDVAAEEFGVHCEVSGPVNESDVDSQIALMREAIAARPDALILAAGDYQLLAPICEEAEKVGIPIITVDSDVNFAGTKCFVATDNYELGKKMAGLVQGLIGPEDRFGVIGHVATVTTAVERRRGLLENIAHADSRLAGVAYCNSSIALAKQQTIEMIHENPDIRCMVGLNESSALGVSAAIQELGLAGKVKLVACDSSQQQIQDMENGTIQAFVIQNPFNMGYLSVQAAVDLLDGRPVEKFINTGSVIVTRDDLYRKENQKLLFPFTDA